MTAKSDRKRIAVIGTSCSGKTTFARQLARRLDLPHVELDTFYWKADWEERPLHEFRHRVSLATAQDRWVIDGNYSKVRDLVWPRATTLIWLNYRFTLVFRQALSRTLRRIVNREVLFAGNRESFRRTFLRHDSILLWVIHSHGKLNKRYGRLFDGPDFPQAERVRLKTPAQAESYLASLKAPD